MRAITPANQCERLVTLIRDAAIERGIRILVLEPEWTVEPAGFSKDPRRRRWHGQDRSWRHAKRTERDGSGCPASDSLLIPPRLSFFRKNQTWCDQTPEESCAGRVS